MKSACRRRFTGFRKCVKSKGPWPVVRRLLYCVFKIVIIVINAKVPAYVAQIDRGRLK